MSPLNNLDNYNLQQRIKEWNATRLDLFKISEPNKRNEFHGVVRFFFQGEDSKYQAKCLRISNTATACQLVNVLVEKFHPDLKRLTAGRYALYEYHASSGERRLGANEAPLMVQLNWAFDDSEVRFVLRDESKPLPSARQRQALENQPSSLQNGGIGAKSKQKPSDNGDHHHGGDGHFSRRWSSGSRKKKKKSKDDTHKDSEHDNIPETTFTRTLSNPDEVLRRRRQQRMQHRNQLDGDAKERDGTVKIYGDSINPEVPFITLRLSPDDTADKVVHWTLEKYGITKQVNPQDYCLVQMNIPPRGERLPLDMERELTLHHQDSPLAIREQVHSMTEHITCVFQIRHRRAIGKDGRRPPPAAPSHPRAPPSSMGTVQRRRTVEHQQPELCSYLIEVSGDSEHAEVPDGLFASVTELFNHSYSGAIRLGTIEKMVGPPPNILVDKNLHPDIRPVHCTFNVVMASTSGSKWRLPSTGQPEELESLTQYSLLITPSLDGFAKPPGPAAIRINDTRITGPMILQPGTVLRLGKSLWLKFVQTYETMDDGAEAITPQATMDRRKNGAPSQNLGEKSSIRTGGSHPGVPRRSTPTEVNSSDQKQISQPEQSRLSAPPNMRSASGVTEDRLPLTIELQGAAEWTSKTNLLDRYVHLVDQVLRSANADLQIMNTRAKEDNRPVIFSLSPAYALYLVYRACQKQATVFCGSNLSDKEHTVSYITNYIATRVFESLPKVISDSTDRLMIIQPLVYWLANSSELLQFLKHDISLCYPSDSKVQLLESSRYSPPLHACRQALHLLADAVDHCFYELRSCMAILLQPLLYCLVHPGDGDMQDDLRLDDKALLPGSYQDSLQQPTKIQAIMQLFTLLMHQIRRARVNASLTIQLFAQLFHMVNSHIFNQALIKSEAKPRHVRESANVWLSRPGASRLLRRLDRIKHWAQRQGLERAAECRLQKCFQACQLVLADRSNLDDFYQLCMSFLSLNSIQLEWLLSHLTDPPPVPDDWIDLIVTGGREVNDRAILDEMEHCSQTNQHELSVPELQLSEPRELPLPLLLPPDGYASDAILTGTPAGLTEFLRPLVSKGLIHVQRNPIATGSKDSRPWIGYLKLSKFDLDSKSNRTGHNESDRHPNGSDTEDSDLETSDSQSEHDKRVSKPNQRFRPRDRQEVVSLRHTSLPNLSVAEFDALAKEAKVPVDSITRFYLRKYNNSLGLSIVAAKAEGQRHYGIYVKDIVRGGAADRDGRLDTGDQILAIGSSNLIGCAQSDAVATLAKQSQSDEGVQLTVAQGAAKYHHILELIRPAAPSKARSQREAHVQSESERPLSENQYRASSTTQLASARTGQKPMSQPRYTTSKPDEANVRGLKSARRFGEASRQSGSLSRSTPSLNLAEVGMDDSDYPAESVATEPKGRVQSKPYYDGHEARADEVNSFARTKSFGLSSNEEQGHRGNIPQGKQLTGTLPATSSDSDEFLEPPAAQRHETRRSSMTTEYTKHGHHTGKSKPASKLHSSHSQPNMVKPLIPHQTTRHSSLSIEPDRPALHPQPNETGSEAFSSLESVSSSQTPCSLHDAAGTITSTKLPKERNRARHPPPPSVPSQKPNRTPLEAKSWRQLNQPYASESELLNRNLDRYHSGSPRPQSASNNPSGSRVPSTWQETSLNSPNDSLPVKDGYAGRPADESGSRSSLASGSLDTVGLDAPSKDEQISSAATSTPGSLAPATIGNTITNPGGKMFTSNRESPTPYNIGADATAGQATKMTPPTVADVSHGQFAMTKPTTGTTMEDSVSESLRPPAHAIVSAPRWPDDRVPSFAPELLPDVPVLHNDPQRGRTSHGSSLTRLDAAGLQVSASSGIGTRADFVPTSLPIHSLPPRSTGFNHGSIIRRSPSPQLGNARQSQDSFGMRPIDNMFQPGLRQPPRDSPPTMVKLNTFGSPPPTPTADFPQYHPPERLEPADWTVYAATPESDHISTSRHSIGSTAPQVAPKPQIPLSYAHRQPVPLANVRSSHEELELSSQMLPNILPAALPVQPIRQSVQLLPQHYTTSAAVRVAQLEAELQTLELRRGGLSGGDADPVIDRLRAELQFQRRLAEREAARKYPPPLEEPRSNERYDRNIVDNVESHESICPSISITTKPNEFKPFVGDFQSSQREWERKRSEAERELEISPSGRIQQRRLIELENEHKALLARQEQRAKERSEWFGQQKERAGHRLSGGASNMEDTGYFKQAPAISHLAHGVTMNESGYPNPSTELHGRYGRPRFDHRQQDARGAFLVPPYPIHSKSGPQVVETEIGRLPPGIGLNDSLRVKKSVSFDKNLETISVYSPPTTPQDSGTENAVAKQPSSAGIVGPSLFHTNLTIPSAVPKSHSSGTLTRNPTPPMEPSPRPISTSPNPVPNAELLPFKEKMRLFAQRIGEEPPKERSKVSSRQKQLLSVPTVIAHTTTRPGGPSYTQNAGSSAAR